MSDHAASGFLHARVMPIIVPPQLAVGTSAELKRGNDISRSLPANFGAYFRKSPICQSGMINPQTSPVATSC